MKIDRKEMQRAWDVVRLAASKIDDEKIPRLEHYDSWTFFRFSMGWDYSYDPARFAYYLKALRAEFPEAAIDISNSDISFRYAPYYNSETLQDTKQRFDKQIDEYLYCTDMKPEHTSKWFREEVRKEMQELHGFVHGYPFQLITRTDNDVCKASGIKRGYFLGVAKYSLAVKLEQYLITKVPDAIVFICRKHSEDDEDVDTWFVVLTWPEYLPEGHKKEEYEYTRKRKRKKKSTTAPDENPDDLEFIKKMFEKHKDVFLRLANK